MNEKGKKGEDAAAKYLKKQGYRILERNYRTPFGEADIVCRKGRILAFTEVKSRSSLRFGSPSEAVDWNKQKRYVLIAKHYMSVHNTYDVCVRFDIVEILDGNINHIQNAFSGE